MKKMKPISFLFFPVVFIISGILVVGSIPHTEKSPLWAMTITSTENKTTYSTTYAKDRVTESFGVGIFPGPVELDEAMQTALWRTGPNEPLEGYLWVNNQMTSGSDFLIFGLLDYQQIPFEFNNTGAKVHHIIHMAAFEESFYHFRIPPMKNGSHDFELFLVMKPDAHSLDDSFRLSTDQALLGSRRLNIIVGNSGGFTPPDLETYHGYSTSCGSDYVLNDGLLVTTAPCDRKALLSMNVSPHEIFEYSINIAADNRYPVSVAIVPLLDYYPVALENTTNNRVSHFSLNPGEKLAIPANVRIPDDEGVHELMVLWIPKPYQSIDDDAKSVRQYHQWAWSEPSIRVGLEVRSNSQITTSAQEGEMQDGT